MGCGSSRIVSCPKCNYTTNSGKDFLLHLEQIHDLKLRNHDEIDAPSSQSIACPNCDTERFNSGQDFVNHLQKSHHFSPVGDNKTFECPKCNTGGFTDIEKLITHVEMSHQSVQTNATLDPRIKASNLPQVGDKVLAMWSQSKWQYFEATIKTMIPDKLQYEIDWDDQDPSGRIVDYFNLAVNKVPSGKEIGIGSIVLFSQGGYSGQAGVRLGGERWHQGKITKCYKGKNGTTSYDGVHTKGEADGKWVTYKGYSYSFTGSKLTDLRVGPNVFDLLNDGDDYDDMDEASEEDVDVYFSYTPNDSPTAIGNQEVTDIPESYNRSLHRLCDPQQIAAFLKAKGLNVVERMAKTQKELKKTAHKMKNAKVFIACISDQYVANNDCRMEFQYAKTSLKVPVVPLVVGDGSFDWMHSVVGMLIAGELYIHFKNKSVEGDKLIELYCALESHLEKLANIVSSDNRLVPATGKADVFISYCWTNSNLAKDSKQIENAVGQEFSDPRLVKKELDKAGFKSWIDIERLRSANAGAGMYEQLTTALKEAKVVVPFVSKEYAASPNCRMEFQFAMKSLGKPIIPVIVGDGSDWKTTVIGALVSSCNVKPIDLQDADNKVTFDDQLQILIKELNNFVDDSKPKQKAIERKPAKQRAPKVGDHVISHHFHSAYYMATIVSFDAEELQYTVDWDDGDPTGRTESFDQVALDVIPDADDVGVGSIIFFPQGSYSGTEGNNDGGQRYHEGIVTSSRNDGNTTLYSGNHTKGEEDGKWITYGAYSHNFKDLPLKSIRIASSAMDALMASTE